MKGKERGKARSEARDSDMESIYREQSTLRSSSWYVGRQGRGTKSGSVRRALIDGVGRWTAKHDYRVYIQR
jgi:hypothetical protein